MNIKLKRCISLILALMTVFSLLFSLSSCTENNTEVDEVKIDTDYVSIDDEISGASIDDEHDVLNIFQELSETLGIENAEKELKISNINEVGGEVFYRAQQYYEDIPVYGNSVVLGVDENGKTFCLTSNTVSVKDVDTTPKISFEDAKNELEKFFKNQKPENILFYSPNELIVYQLDDGENILAYNTVVSISTKSQESETFECIVNAYNGEVVKALQIDLFESVEATGKDNTGNNRKRSFTVNRKSDSEYLLQDNTRNINIYDVGNKELTYKFYDENNEGTNNYNSFDHVEYLSNGNKLKVVANSSNQWDDTKAVTLMANLKDTYDFYDKYLAYKGTNGKNNIINGFFNDSMPSAGSGNAYCWGYAKYWQDEVLLSFGVDNGISVDTVAHEYTHGVEGSISRMNYEGESGAIMEAYSDIFGEFVEDYANDGELDGDCNWIHGERNMIDPLKNNYPSIYNGKHFASTKNKLKNGKSENDNGGVHKNNTVISHAAYLMYNGIDGTESMRISTEMLSGIWFRSLQLLYTNSTFQQCANAVYTSAKTTRGITAEQLSCVVKAFEAVGIEVTTGSYSVACKGALFHVKDMNFKNYGNYHLKIYDLKDLRNPQIIVDTDINNTDGYNLDFEQGNYKIIVTDNDVNGSKKEYCRCVNIIDGIRSQNTSPKNVIVYTDFGGKTVDDFTIPAESVITLGELSVIEPEITPADATSYSIKWTSSDESVATVSPNGEAGIITTLSKGTATITAELTSGEKTITKTTDLRVASKARDTVLVLDVSGSMDGNPLTEMKKSAIQFCNDLLKDEYNNRVGIVFYDDGYSTIELSNDLDMLVSRIQSISDGGRTDMEAGLSAADEMLKNDGKSDSVKNVVIMADGLPNEGKTSSSGSMPVGSYSGYYTSVSYANAVIDTAQQMMNRYNLYSLGFFHGLYSEEKDFATALMKELTNQADGYHQVDKAEDLQFAFGDISEDINVGSKIVINIACPVDVKISCGGEMLCSSSAAFCDVTSFGTLQLLGKNKDIKVVSLDSDKEYEIEIVGTGAGKMDYSVNYFDELERLSDYRSFEAVPITATTVIKTDTANTSKDITLNIDDDGDGEIDVIWTALSKSKGQITYEKTPSEPETIAEDVPVIEEGKDDMPIWVIVLIGVFAVVLIASVIVIASVSGKERELDSEFDNLGELPAETVKCSRCGKTHLRNKPCECLNSENKESITEESESGTGFIQITNGSMNGFSVPIKDGETLYLGKDSKFANLVFTNDYQKVSRMHCTVTFDAKTKKYYVTDCSSNGTYLIGKKRLVKGKRTPVNKNTVLILATDECTVLLG